AENHPVGFKWFMEAKRGARNAKLCVVDPRFTRTAAVADVYAPIRAGTDIAFLLGLIRYAIENKRYHEDYVKIHPHASYATGDRGGTITYALGWTQHSTGVQIIRAAAMLQLLLGNVGRPGGGVNAFRGHSNIQGATDTAGTFEILPGYLKTPTGQLTNLKEYY